MSKLIAAFDVYHLIAGGVKTYIPNAEVKVYHGTTNALLATVNAGSHGVVLPFTIGAIAQDIPVYYEYLESSVHYRGGQGNSGAYLFQDIVVAADQFESFYPAGNEQPVALKVAIKDAADSNATWQFAGEFSPAGNARIPLGSLTDRNVIISVISRTADGTESHSEFNHAPQSNVQVQLISDAPTAIQAGAATETQVVVLVDNVPAIAAARRMRIATNAGMTTGLMEYPSSSPLPISETINGTAGQTIYVDFAHSATPGTAGPWSPASTPLMLTFASIGGGGGTSGDGDPYGRGSYDY
jgi:hypothetical protein